MSDAPIRLVISDVDGTLVTKDKLLTERSRAAVQRLRDAGIQFAITSSRPPRGLAMIIQPLAVSTPVGAFNGAVFVDAGLGVLEQHPIPDAVVAPMVDLFETRGLDAWVYRGSDWLVRDATAPHVEHEASVVKFSPTVVADLAVTGVAKIVGVSDDPERVARVEGEAWERFGADASATRSQAYYLDVTHPQANKGYVVEHLGAVLGIPVEQIATVGDGANDVLMFAESGLSVAMGNATPDVQQSAHFVTDSNDDDGFSRAVDEFILPKGA